MRGCASGAISVSLPGGRESRRRGVASRRGGFSLQEILVAVGLMGLGILPLMTGWIDLTRLTGMTRERGEALRMLLGSQESYVALGRTRLELLAGPDGQLPTLGRSERPTGETPRGPWGVLTGRLRDALQRQTFPTQAPSHDDAAAPARPSARLESRDRFSVLVLESPTAPGLRLESIVGVGAIQEVTPWQEP